MKLITYQNSITIKLIVELDNWNAQKAIEALNKSCFDLHKGTDGVSKTWNEVEVEAIVNFN